LLAACGPEGCTEAVMLANGVDVDTMVQFATATPQRTRAGREVLEVATLRITEKGRQALAAKAWRARSLDNPEHWRRRAAAAQLVAEQLDDPVAKAAMLRIAEDYDRIAEHARMRANGSQS
jgi:hypothetical protein